MYDQTPEQVKAEKVLNKQGFEFSNWIAASPDADGDSTDDKGTMVMVKTTTRHSREYKEIEPDGSIN